MMLIIFTMIIVISAAFRMHLYEQKYGYTYLRLFVYFTLVTEMLVLIPILSKLFGLKIDTFKTTIEIVVTMYVILNFININKIIAKNNIDKYSFTLNEKSNELNRLEILTKENQRLRDRETYLSNLLIKDIRVIKNLKDKKSPINILQWDEIKKNIDLLFDNYTIRLSQVIPSMTESDLQVCCLIKLRFSNLDIADILNISPTSVSKRKFRLKERIIQKLGSLGESHTLDLWLLEFQWNRLSIRETIPKS